MKYLLIQKNEKGYFEDFIFNAIMNCFSNTFHEKLHLML